MSDFDHRCPSCGSTGLRCCMTEGRTGSPCCSDCALQPVQQPMHVWPAADPSNQEGTP